MCADCKLVVHAVWQERHRGVCTRVEDGRQLEGGSIHLRDRPRATVEPEENDVRPGGPLPHPERAKKCPLCAKIVAAEHECVIMDCALCGTRVNRTHYALHLGTTRHRKAEEARWAQEQKACLACQGLEQEGHTCGFAPCSVCGVWVDNRFQAVHEATGGHRAAVVAGQKEERGAARNETPVNRCPFCKVLVEEGPRCEVVQCDVYDGRAEAPRTATKKHRKAAEKAMEQEERARKAREGGTSEGAAADITDGQPNWCLSRGEIATDAHRWGVVMLTTDVDGNEAGVEYRVGAERRAKERQQAREDERGELEREEKRREKEGKRKERAEKEKKKREEIEKIEKERKEREEDERREREKMEKMEKERKERVEEERKNMEKIEIERKEREEKEKKQREKMEKERKKREDDKKKERKKMEKMEKEREGREEEEKKKREEIEKERKEREEEERKERVKMEGERREKEKMEQKEQEKKEKQEIEKQEQDRREREKIEQRQFNAKKEEQRKERAKIKKRNEEQKQKPEKKKQEDQRQAAKQEHTARENTEEVHTQPAQGTGRRRKKKPTLDTPLNDAATPSLVVPKLRPSPSQTERKREARERRILEETRGVQEPMQTGLTEVQRLRETEKAVGDMEEKHEEAERRMQQVRQASASTETRLPEELQKAEKAKRQRGRSKKGANSIASQVQESTGASGLKEKQKQVRILTVFSVHRADGHSRQCRMSGSWSWKR